MKRILLGLVVLIAGISAQAQNRCHADEMTQALWQNQPEVKAEMERIDREIEEYSANRPTNHQSEDVIVIPVVVHVVYANNNQNISDAQIQSQITVLNEDFRAMNSDTNLIPSAFKGDLSDTEIEFCLAERDPNGFATTGITRTQTTKSSFSNDDVKDSNAGGKDGWPRNSYLNIWVCNLSGGILGYAYQPGAPASIDGVVIGYNYFGSIDYDDGSFILSSPYNKGRTATHEVGHWLNLDHVWGSNGCSTDNVNDTPLQQGPNFGCPNFPSTSTCNSVSNGPDGDMFMNYMDYVNDACMHLFSNGQGLRMNDALLVARASIRFSLGCDPGTPIGLNENPVINDLNFYPNPVHGQANLKLTMLQKSNLHIRIVSGLGQLVWEKSVESQMPGQIHENIDLSGLSSGIYHLSIQAGGQEFSKEFLIQN